MTTGEPVRHSVLIPAAKLRAHPDNPREKLGNLEGLTETIRRAGLLQPLTVMPDPGRPGEYYVIAGNRRLVAGQRAGMTQFPCVVRETASPRQVMLIENCHREDLSPVEKARAMGALRDGEDGGEPMTVSQIARETGMSQPTVSSYLALLELDWASQERVRDGSLPVAEAVAAVRRTRGDGRTKRGRAGRGKTASLAWEPDHFTSGHPLARQAAAVCEAREHGLRRRIGKTAACGACWESAIRADERKIIEAAGRNGSAAMPSFVAP